MAVYTTSSLAQQILTTASDTGFYDDIEAILGIGSTSDPTVYDDDHNIIPIVRAHMVKSLDDTTALVTELMTIYSRLNAHRLRATLVYHMPHCMHQIHMVVTGNSTSAVEALKGAINKDSLMLKPIDIPLQFTVSFADKLDITPVTCSSNKHLVEQAAAEQAKKAIEEMGEELLHSIIEHQQTSMFSSTQDGRAVAYSGLRSLHSNPRVPQFMLYKPMKELHNLDTQAITLATIANSTNVPCGTSIYRHPMVALPGIGISLSAKEAKGQFIASLKDNAPRIIPTNAVLDL